MNISIEIKSDDAVNKILSAVGPEARHSLFSTAAEGVGNLVKDHILRLSFRRHFTSSRLGAPATGHLSNGVRAISWSSSSSRALVAVPIPGISRAWHDLDILPVNSSALTLPVDKASYGKRVSEVEKLGWKVFKLRGKDVLMGSKNGETRVLYVLKRQVRQPQDAELLPTNVEISGIASKSMASYIARVLRKAA